MKIHVLPPSVTATGHSPSAGKLAQTGASRTTLDDVSSSVTVSLSGSLSGAGGPDAGADVDVRKVERMRQALADGSFQANPEVIADKLIGHAYELMRSVEIKQ